MKTVLTFVLVLFFSATAMAQQTDNNDKVDIIEMGVVLVTGNSTDITFKTVTGTAQKSIARLYKTKNARVLKELNFSTKKSRPKMA
ncbi:hypothetical protein [Maribacter sp. 2210JD10-5]|uniref:hypothetical protein n=1 Tax=Maribacter sp. 2210JD10-5 TaxID=3386272 RepID=UPI0039BCEA8A